jgi:tetratricopeptide (TPR) repeat protein
MADRLAALYRTRYAALHARLNAPGASRERERLKSDIADLFRALDAELGELGKLKDDVRQLIERWKALDAAPGAQAAPSAAPSSASVTAPSNAPEFPGERPVVHADHLGASTFIEKGWNLISSGEYTAAEAALTKALELSPGEPQAESLLGWAMMLNERYDEALLAFRKVLMREPANALARVNLGYVCLRKGLLGEAIEHLSRAIRLDKDRRATMYANFYLGLVYIERNMLDDAQTFLKKAIALGPNLLQAHYELGRAYWRSGRRDEARATWREAYAANKLNPWGKRCGEALDAVEKGGTP